MSRLTHEQWQALAASQTFEGRAFIDGQYVAAASGRTFATVNPANKATLAEVAECGEAEVNRAVKAARAAFEDGRWANLAPVKRKTVLLKFAELIRDNADELALLETLDTGKPVGDSLGVDVAGAAYCVQWYAEAIDKVGGEVAPLAPNLHGTVTREAIGVVAAVVPWNFPLLMASWKFAPALAAGNSVILKPSEKSPLTAIRVAALAKEAGIPDGVFNVVPGAGETGRLLALHMDVDCLAFTGSTAVGKRIMACAAESNLKRVWLELGGKSPNIVLDDCPDIAQAARTAAGGIFFNQGEMCSAGSRVLVHRSIYPKFMAELKKAAEGYRPGDPLNPSTGMGAIVDELQYRRVLDYIAIGKAESTLAFGGDAVHTDTGYYIAPTAFETTPDSRIAREEIFGPVCAVIPFDTEDEAVAIANDSEYGLAAGLWTRDVSRAHRLARRLRAGTVWINCYDEGGDQNLPFGGYKQSGNGRDKSLHALEKYTELKSTLLKLYS
ncbi:aldehyde dehydrogenase [Crenobacter cavernae]|uniref:Aldehyde dehydrogenase n=1 Tax=Crenobacter cavernae TaxID=2290923 RepID=A0ABY0FF25_9NEIS|nr:aldehyde dehydrogenase [Crenobacter cavernae]RXZ43685.1 aldehyde dehydrogenase [Crenobacter cavernae]